MQRPKGSILATVGAMVMTVVAGSTALAVNGGILRSTPDTGVGELETVATVATVSADPQDPNIRYVTVFVDDPVPAAATAPAVPAVPVASSDDSAFVDDDFSEGDGEHAEDHSEDGEEHEDETHDEDGPEDEEHEDEEHEGADDDD